MCRYQTIHETSIGSRDKPSEVIISNPRLRGGFFLYGLSLTFLTDPWFKKNTLVAQVGALEVTFVARVVSPPARRGRAGLARGGDSAGKGGLAGWRGVGKAAPYSVSGKPAPPPASQSGRNAPINRHSSARAERINPLSPPLPARPRHYASPARPRRSCGLFADPDVSRETLLRLQ